MPERVVVLLGASNVTASEGVLRRLVGSPTADEHAELRIAAGRGRAYAVSSRFMLGSLRPGVRDCDLWGTLDRANGGSRHAIVTDIGNDLLYGVTPHEAARAVAECLDRLLAWAPSVRVTGLPVPVIQKVEPWRFRLFQALFFPTCRVPRRTLFEGAEILDGLLHDVCGARGLSVEPPDPEWYGFDPIHYRPAVREAIWRDLLRPAVDSERSSRANGRSRVPVRWF